MTVRLDPTHGRLTGNVLKALAVAQGDPVGAHAWAVAHQPDAAAVLKGLVNPTDSTAYATAMGLVSNDLTLALRRPSVFARASALMRRTAFSTRVLAGQSGPRGSFVAPGAPAPMASASFASRGQLTARKVIGTHIASAELLRSSVPGAQQAFAEDLAGAVADAIDGAFCDPLRGETTAEPGSISRDGVATQLVSTGATISAIQDDLKTMLDTMAATGTDFSAAAWIMAPATATTLAAMTGSSDLNAFPFVTPRGGSLLGLPVFTTTSVADFGSPSDRAVILADFAQVAYADDGFSEVALSEYGAVQSDDAPAAGGQTLVSLWQHGMVGAMATRLVSWRVMRPGAVVTLRGVAY